MTVAPERLRPATSLAQRLRVFFEFISSTRSVATPGVNDPTANLKSGPTYRRTEVCALPEETIVNVKAIDPAHGAGLENIPNIPRVARGGPRPPRSTHANCLFG